MIVYSVFLLTFHRHYDSKPSSLVPNSIRKQRCSALLRDTAYTVFLWGGDLVCDSAGTLDLNLRMESVKCYIWNIALYGAESGTLGKLDQKYNKSFEK